LTLSQKKKNKITDLALYSNNISTPKKISFRRGCYSNFVVVAKYTGTAPTASA
jgi:hypothetical protein